MMTKRSTSNKQRQTLDKGDILRLYTEKAGNGAQNVCEFHITKLVSDRGASTIAYKAYHQNSSKPGILREFYPKNSLVIDREASGRIQIDHHPDFEKEREEYLERKERYLEPYRELRKIQLECQSEKEHDDLYSFIPYFEIYCGSCNPNDGTIYIWTPVPQVETFEAICEEIHENPTIQPEYKLYLVLSALYSLTECVKRLHMEGLIHRDIKPDNFGFVRRNEKVLTQSISLFDIDSIRKIYPPPAEDIDMGTPGFIEPARERKHDLLRDIYSIGATMFYAVVDTDEVRKNGYKYDPDYFQDIPKLVRSSRLIQSSETNSHPRLRSYLSRILRKCLCPRYTSNPGRYRVCEELAMDLKKALGYILPSGMSLKLLQGEKWVLSDARKWFSANEEKNAKLVLQYHLYKWPLYQNISRDDDEINVLLIGFGKYGYKFLDLSLQYAQNIGKAINVRVISNVLTEGDETDQELYLQERPELESFFKVSKKEYNDDTYYGSICFDEQEEMVRCDVLKRISVEKASYVFIDLGDDNLNQNAAQEICGLGCEGAINYVLEERNGGEYYGESIFPVYISEDVRNMEFYPELERMAFNAHLVWNDNLNINFQIKQEEFHTEYNFNSCISNVLSIKYKLWSMGIDIDNMSVYEAAEKFHELIQKDEKIKKELAWAEHRRWVTEKICDGWKKREIKDCVQDTKDKNLKTHVCIVKSEKESKIEGLDEKMWDIGGVDIEDFDELDRVSIGLHRLYENQIGGLGIQNFSDIDKALQGTRLIPYFEEWHDSMKNVIEKRDKESVRLCKAFWIRFKNEMNRIKGDELTETQKNYIISTVEECMTPFMKRYECLDYKQIDVNLIERIPFILTYSAKISLLIPLELYRDVKESDEIQLTAEYIFKNIAPAILINPREINYLYYAKGSMEQVRAEEKILKYFARCILQYRKIRELQAKIKLVFFYDEQKIGRFFSNSELFDSELFDSEFFKIILKKVGQSKQNSNEVENQNKGISHKAENQDKGIINKIEEYVQELDDDKRIILLEKNSVLTKGWMSGSSIEKMCANYEFDCANREFFHCDDCRWLNYINKHVSIRAKDIAHLTDRKYKIDERLKFTAKQGIHLWKTYKEDNQAWKWCSGFLSRETVQKTPILKVNRDEAQKGEKGNYQFFFPWPCMETVKWILEEMAKRSLLEESSRVYACSDNICCFEARCTGKTRDLIDKMLSKPYTLENREDISINTDTSGYVIFEYNGLEVQEADLKEYMNHMVSGNQLHVKDKERILQKIQNLLIKMQGNGYIHNLRTKQRKACFTYGAHTIKKLLDQKGKMLEFRVIQELEQQECFDDIVGGMTIYGEHGQIWDELDCIVTKGFKMVIIECKSQDDISQKRLKEFIEKLQERIRKYGINAKGLLLIDSSKTIPKYQPSTGIYVKRVDDIQENGNNKIALYVQKIMESIGEGYEEV